MNALISVLLPTRKRIKKVESSLRSLLEKSKDASSIEICIAYDDDDNESHDYFTGNDWKKFLEEFSTTSMVLRTKRHGYTYLHEYLNELAPMSHGEWLFFWGDDAIMQTPHWDDHVRHNRDYVGLLHITAENMPMRCSILPLFHRDWIKLFGCVTPVNPADSWISEICIEAKCRRVIPVSVLHRLETDEPDETFLDKKKSVDWHKLFWEPESRALRSEWAKRLKEYRSKSV
jgi:hypothetical protein